MTASLADIDPCSVDGFLGGKVTLVQPRSGHRAGLDAALLQALVPAEAAGHAVDLGSGAGTVALSLAARAPALQVIGLEHNPDLIACARQALQHPANGRFAARVRFVQEDATARRSAREAAGLMDGSVDWVLMNPPFDEEGKVRASPDPARRFAHVADPGMLSQWCRTAAGLLKPGGKVGIIHRAAAIRTILEALEGRFGDCRILPIYPTGDSPASRVLVLAISGSRAGPQIMPGLALHDENGGWTGAAELILRGQGHIAL